MRSMKRRFDVAAFIVADGVALLDAVSIDSVASSS